MFYIQDGRMHYRAFMALQKKGDDDECNFVAFMAFKSPKDPSPRTSQGHKGFKEDEDEILNTYNELLNEHIKLKKARKLFGEYQRKLYNF